MKEPLKCPHCKKTIHGTAEFIYPANDILFALNDALKQAKIIDIKLTKRKKK